MAAASSVAARLPPRLRVTSASGDDASRRPFDWLRRGWEAPLPRSPVVGAGAVRPANEIRLVEQGETRVPALREAVKRVPFRANLQKQLFGSPYLVKYAVTTVLESMK